METVETRELVQKWFAAGPFTDEGLAMITDDFEWVTPPSMTEYLFEGDNVIRGRDQLRRLPLVDHAVYAGYQGGGASSNLHFLIADGDRAVMQIDASFTTHDGERYHNFYCFAIRCRDGRICQLWEHADTHYFYEKILGTAEKRAGVQERLAKLRAEAT
jgi:SnoaL-like domain